MQVSARSPNSAATAITAAADATVITAFDGMRVRWDRLGELPAVMGRVNAMFVAHDEYKKQHGAVQIK